MADLWAKNIVAHGGLAEALLHLYVCILLLGRQRARKVERPELGICAEVDLAEVRSERGEQAGSRSLLVKRKARRERPAKQVVARSTPLNQRAPS